MFPDVIYSLKIDIFDLLLFAQSDREVPATSAGKPLLSPPYPPLPLPPPPSSTPPYPLQRPPYLTSSRTLPEQPNERASRAVPEQPHKGSWRTLPGKSFKRTWRGLLWTFRGGGASIEFFAPKTFTLCCDNSSRLSQSVTESQFVQWYSCQSLSSEQPWAFAFKFYSDRNGWSYDFLQPC